RIPPTPMSVNSRGHRPDRRPLSERDRPPDRRVLDPDRRPLSDRHQLPYSCAPCREGGLVPIASAGLPDHVAGTESTPDTTNRRPHPPTSGSGVDSVPATWLPSVTTRWGPCREPSGT